MVPSPKLPIASGRAVTTTVDSGAPAGAFLAGVTFRPVANAVWKHSIVLGSTGRSCSWSPVAIVR